MRRRTAPVLLVLLLLLPTVAARAAEPAAPGPADSSAAAGQPDPTGRYIVVVRAGANPRTVRDRHTKRDGLHADRLFSRALHGFAGTLSTAQLASLRSDRDVAAVVPDELVEAASQLVPTGVSRVGGRLSPMAKIDGQDQRIDADVAVVDTGIDASHPDLNVVGGVNCSTSDRTAWRDGNGHGTHVSGTIGAIDNGSGVVGVAPGVRLWAVRILNNDGYGLLSWYVCGLDWIAAQRDPADASRPLFEAVNMSVTKWGSDDGNCGLTNNDVLHQAICRVVAGGSTVVAAAANDSGSAAARVPASYNEVITVSALADTDGKAGGLGGNRCWSWGGYDVDDTFADFSNYGSDVDIIAPGKCIWSTLPGNHYGYSSGTSMAAPAVTGAVALYRSTRPWVTPDGSKVALQLLGNSNWFTSTDPDSRHERLLDVSRLGPVGDFSVGTGPITPVGEAGGSQIVPVTLARSPTHFETVALTARGPAGFTAQMSPTSLTGFGATTASLLLAVPPSTPAGEYPVTVTATEGPHIHESTATVVVENDAPTAFAPVSTFGYRYALGLTDSTAPLRVRWPVATDPTSGIAAYEIEHSLDWGAWGELTSAAGTATQVIRPVAIGHTHRFRIRARDAAGNWSPWVVGQPLRVGLVQDTSTAIDYSGAWYRGHSRWASGGTTAWTVRTGSSLRLTISARQLAVVAPVSREQGWAKIYVNGVYQATISLYSRIGASRRVLWVKTFSTDGPKTIEIRAVRTATRYRVDIDAILVGR